MLETNLYAAEKLAEAEAFRRDAELRRSELRRIAKAATPSAAARLVSRITGRHAAAPRPAPQMARTEDQPVWS